VKTGKFNSVPPFKRNTYVFKIYFSVSVCVSIEDEQILGKKERKKERKEKRKKERKRELEERKPERKKEMNSSKRVVLYTGCDRT